MRIFDDILQLWKDGFWGTLALVVSDFVGLALILTTPLLIVPYLIYKKLKEMG